MFAREIDAADQQYDSEDEKIAHRERPTFAGDIACAALKAGLTQPNALPVA